jgi:hypothetical protein
MNSGAGKAVRLTAPGHAIVDSLEKSPKLAALAAGRADILIYLLFPISMGRAKVDITPSIINSFSFHDFLPFQTSTCWLQLPADQSHDPSGSRLDCESHQEGIKRPSCIHMMAGDEFKAVCETTFQEAQSSSRTSKCCHLKAPLPSPGRLPAQQRVELPDAALFIPQSGSKEQI